MRSLIVAALVATGLGCASVRVSVYGDVDVPDGSPAVQRSVVTEAIQALDLNEAETRIGVRSVEVTGGVLRLQVVNNSPSEDALLRLDESSLAVLGQTYRVVNGNARVMHAQFAQVPVVVQAGAAATVDLVAPDAPSLAAVASAVPVSAVSGTTEVARLRLYAKVGAESVAKTISVGTRYRVVTATRLAYSKDFDVDVHMGHRVACALTFPLYGGWCLAYLAMPNTAQSDAAREKARADIAARYGADAKVGALFVRRAP